LKVACSVASLVGMVKVSGATALVDAPLHWLKVQVALAVAGIETLVPSTNRPAGQLKLVAGEGEPTVPQPLAVSVSKRHAFKVAPNVSAAAGMVSVRGLFVLPSVHCVKELRDPAAACKVTGAPCGHRPAAHV